MWDEIQDCAGEIFDFDQWIDAALTPETIAEIKASNALIDAEIAQLP